MVVMHKELGSKRVPSLHQHFPNLALIRNKGQLYRGNQLELRGNMLKEDGRKPGETDKTITSQGGRLSPKLSELGLDYKISSLSQKIAYIHTRTFLHPPYFEYLRGCFKAIFKKRLILYNFKLS